MRNRSVKVDPFGLVFPKYQTMHDLSKTLQIDRYIEIKLLLLSGYFFLFLYDVISSF